ncbi:ATP synthase subunit alpha [Candidatus Fokinia solitaria]|uniref:ATP synthase subunit alpha n=1 Tax=Candidatus Fokinia solitaria TaxID=1802984 RepID=A0A2U8BRQ4_9RICK|nr:F0F1 ATP synthase subunit alpha [Candidatus Fokinia solitaria]AWD33025.1 ATP synthase subunit alpha [Candidatus Fokinia solitaria]
MLDLKQIIQAKISQLIHENSEGIHEYGIVVKAFDGIAIVYGLLDVGMSEHVTFQDGGSGIVLSLEDDVVGIAMIDVLTVREGAKVYRTKQVLQIPVGMELLGRIVDPLGNVLDGLEPFPHDIKRSNIEQSAPDIMSRKSVSEPLQTGIQVIDGLIPIGRGQRELIIGDKQTGKTTIAIDAIIRQAKINSEIKNKADRVYCVYVAIGQKRSSIAKIAQLLKKHDAMDYTVIVAASASESPTLKFLAPYSGSSIGEFFRDNKMHALVVYDDLSKHAVAYRELSLLLKKPSGREAYPGDVFYIHSRLLERAAKLSEQKGGGSLTALPIIETQGGDVSAYVPTNVISITDGQIFLESELFYNGVRPAVNVGLSVSRVGSAAQLDVIKKLTGIVRLELAQYREIESFSQFSMELDKATTALLERGKRTVEMLKQDQHQLYGTEEQAILMFSIVRGHCDDIPVQYIQLFKTKLVEYIRENGDSISSEFSANSYKLTAALEEFTSALLVKFKRSFSDVLRAAREV